MATSTLTAIENKIPNVSNFVKKTDYNTKISEIEKKFTDHEHDTDHNHDKYITTPKFNRFTAEIFAARLKLANLVTNTKFDNKFISLNRKINSIKIRHLFVENHIKKLQTLYSIYFRGKSHFEEDVV